MKIHHIGYYVCNTEAAVEEFFALGYEISQPAVLDETRKVEITFMNNGTTCVELVAPVAGCEIFSKKMQKMGTMPYHICYEVDDLDKSVAMFTKRGYILVKEAEKAVAIDNKKVVFLYSENMGTIELVEK